MSNDSTKKMVTVALGVCLVCSILVSTAAVALNARQEKNKESDKIKNILIAGELMQEGIDVKAVFDSKVQPEIVNLQSGEFLPESDYNAKLDPATFNVKVMADDPDYGTAIPADKDLARIRRMPKYMTIYIVKVNDQAEKYILPIYGKGLWSTLYGFLALNSDLQTIEGITFYEHGETPGLGGEVDNPRWKEIWKGKQVFRENGEVGITVIKGQVDPDDPDAQYEVDGLSGSTLTTRGLDAMVKFWLGDSGYGPFIRGHRIQKEEINEQG
ncbi:Na(+)-translocating NADH-quinone reductase subunit C [candidate division KSB1 bacterium]|nr:Na(+)-translocating NADH-quinone reductase subunit C [candidate division KSB1 bacterium]RQW08542.1 MAG: Na(+)-translocating NADH-quinone reductase subunit C [candidate division KSB1 bacterium]